MRKELNIHIEMGGILDQINGKAYYAGKVKTPESDPAAAVSEIIDEGNAYIVAASLAKAVGNLQGIIGSHAPNTLAVTGTIKEPSVSGTITLASNYDESAAKAIESSILQYCEAGALYDWFALTSPADTAYYVQEQAYATSKLEQALRRRVRPTARHNRNEENRIQD